MSLLAKVDRTLYTWRGWSQLGETTSTISVMLAEHNGSNWCSLVDIMVGVYKYSLFLFLCLTNSEERLSAESVEKWGRIAGLREESKWSSHFEGSNAEWRTKMLLEMSGPGFKPRPITIVFLWPHAASSLQLMKQRVAFYQSLSVTIKCFAKGMRARKLSCIHWSDSNVGHYVSV